ncbi:MAG: quinone oxidoreductase [Actinobacteria bacterium]|nr:quinone oxidoreductase [Actinomycetota bacterium]
MRALVVSEHGGPEVLAVRELPEPTPDAGQVSVRVTVSGVNFIDVYHRTGLYPMPLPFVLGLEGVGTVASLGAAVTGLAVGDRVGWSGTPGSHADVVVVPADRLVRIPDGIDDESATSVLLQGMTAHYLASSTYPVQPGDWVLVHAAAGGVGVLLTQIIRSRGGHVIGTVSTAAKETLARQFGAEHVIRYADADDVAGTVRALTGGRGVAAVYDGVGASTFESSLASLRPRGMLVLFGQSSGPVPPFDLARLNTAGSLYVTRPTLGHYLADRAELTWRAGEVLGWVADGSLSVHIGRSYPLADARAAYGDLEARRSTGKLLLTR